ncbi:hypothetical protein Tco_1114845 [Tanacetum coccineum]
MVKFFCSAIRFKLKLQNLKKAIKSWRIIVNESETAAATVLRDGIKEIDQKAEVSPLTLADVNLITNNVRLLANIEHQKLKDLNKKAKIK